MTDDILKILSTMRDTGQPGVVFQAVEALAKTRIGHQLFTLLYVDGDEVARTYSNRPAEYPVSGRKPMGKTDWGDLVLKQQKPFLARDKAGIRWAFFDHALIESMGLGSAICIPVVYGGECLGTMNILDAEHSYGDAQVALVAPLAPLLIPGLLEARRKAV